MIKNVNGNVSRQSENGKARKDSKVKADQIRTLNRRRLIKHIGVLEQRNLYALAMIP